MIISACTVILLIICERFAAYEKDYTPNVGTVLFNMDDIQKKQWAKTDIGLLRARRYFQSLLPPPIFINTFNEDYVNILLGYFRDAYSTIKREATDAETDTIMTSALSDAIGGYLKVWVLPVAKLDYYGGTVSQDNVIKLFQFYNEIKRYLDTDGDGWRKPDENVLNSITINVAPLKFVSNTRSMKNPCDHLAYFEKTTTGLSIPMPNVNWNDKSSTMFIPLKNVSLIMMNTPDTSHNLIKYYDAARSCSQTSNPREQDNFDEKFQSWLANEVVPHLKDDNLYLALGSVLTLVNRTRDLCNSVIDLYSNRFNIINKPPHMPMDLTSKKMWIISIILLIEVAWCIPALIYILCSKRGHKKDCCSNVYLYIDNNKPDKKGKGNFFKTKTSRIQQGTCSTALKPVTCGEHRGSKTGMNLFCKPQQSNMEFEAQYPSSMMTNTAGTDTRSYFSSKDQSASAMRITCQAPKNSENSMPKKSSLKKSSSQKFSSNHTNSTQVLAMSSQEPIISTTDQSVPSSYTTIQRYSRNASPMSVDMNCQKSRRSSKQKVEEYKAEEERKQIEECKKYEERRKAEECRKREERERAEEYRKFEKRRNSEECRKLDDRRKAEECRKVDDRRKAEECRKPEERRKAEECRKPEERRKAEECRKPEERRKAEECRKPEERRKAEECRKPEERRKAEECRKPEERRKAEECRKPEERRKAEECRKPEDHRKAEECRKPEEHRKAEECRKPEERRKAEECRKPEDRRKSDESRKLPECRKAEECRTPEDRRKSDESRKLPECRKAEECRKNDELRKDDECRKNYERNKDDDCKMFEEQGHEECSAEPESSEMTGCIVHKYEVIEIKESVIKQLDDDDSENCDDENEMEESQDTENDSPCGATCACISCMQKGCKNSMSNSNAYGNTSCCSSSRGVVDKQVETKTTRFQVTKELKTPYTKGGIKLTSGQPYLEITIDRPATEICVDVAQYREHTPKPSKIPKPAGGCNVLTPVTFASTVERTQKLREEIPHNEKHKSMIPQPKKKTEDDIAIKSRHSDTSSENKLNETF